jgi:hypothetical protein
MTDKPMTRQPERSEAKRKKERKMTTEEQGGDGRTLVEKSVKKRGEIAVMSTESATGSEGGMSDRAESRGGRVGGRKEREDKREREGECRGE